MTLAEYQNESKKTAIYPKDRGLEYVTLGLAGEAGEISNKVKKVIRDDNSILSKEKHQGLVEEAGDVLWYLSQLCTELNVSLGDVAHLNLDKLLDRKDRGKLGGSGDER